MHVAHSVFKQIVLNVSGHQLQQTMIKICCQMIQLPYNELVKQIILYHRQNGLLSRHYVGQPWRVPLIVFQYSTSHMIIHWHIHMVHFLLFLYQNCSLVTGSLRKLYY